MVELHLLGGILLERDGRPVTGRAVQRHPLALLALLATSPGQTASRDKLMAYLWPEVDVGRGRHRLSVALHVLRKALGPGCITTLSDGVTLDEACVRTDVAAFEGALGAGRLQAAVDLYGGPFLDGFFVSGAPELERWVQEERNRLAALYAGALERLASEAAERGDARAAVEWGKLLAAHDPLNARVALALIEALRAAGDPAGAWQHARAHSARVTGELELPPDPAVVAVAAELPAEVAQQQREWREGAPPEPPRAATVRRAPARVTLAASAAFVAVALVIWGSAVRPRVEDEPPRLPRVAVLPFSSASGDPEERALGQQLARRVATTLGHVPGLQLTVGDSAPTRAGLGAAIRLGRAMDADFLIAGTVRHGDGRGSATVRLIHSPTGEDRWVERFERSFREPGRFLDEMSLGIADALRLRLAPYEPKVYTSSDRAYDRFLQGVHAHRGMTEESLWKALQLYREGYEEDEEFALAHAISANAYIAMVGVGREPDVAFQLARQHALEALAIDSSLAEGHVALAVIQIWHDWDLASGEQSLRRAIMLYPTLPQARSYYGHFLLRTSDSPDAALAHIRRALELDPLNAARSHTLERALLLAGRYPEALEQSRVTRTLAPDRDVGSTPATAYRELGRYDEALAEYKRLTERAGGRAVPGLALTYARMSRVDEAWALLPDLEARAEAGTLPAERLAAVYGSLGDLDRAFHWLERAYADRSGQLLTLRVEPDLNPLREDPRFGELCRRVGLAC